MAVPVEWTSAIDCYLLSRAEFDDATASAEALLDALEANADRMCDATTLSSGTVAGTAAVAQLVAYERECAARLDGLLSALDPHWAGNLLDFGLGGKDCGGVLLTERKPCCLGATVDLVYAPDDGSCCCHEREGVLNFLLGHSQTGYYDSLQRRGAVGEAKSSPWPSDGYEGHLVPRHYDRAECLLPDIDDEPPPFSIYSADDEMGAGNYSALGLFVDTAEVKELIAAVREAALFRLPLHFDGAPHGREGYAVCGQYLWAIEGKDRLTTPADLLAEVQYKIEKQRRKADGIRKFLAGKAMRPSRARIPDEVLSFVFHRDGGRCAKCGASSSLEIDHIIPVSKGGGDSPANLQVLCDSCNRYKSNHI